MGEEGDRDSVGELFAEGEEEEGAVGKLLVEVQGIEIATELAEGGNFRIDLFKLEGFPDEFAQFEGDFAFAGFVGENVGVEAINGQMLEGFAGEGRGERWFAVMGGLVGDFGVGWGVM